MQQGDDWAKVPALPLGVLGTESLVSIQITPDMIAAGASVITQTGERTAEETAVTVFRSMVEAAQGKRSSDEVLKP